MNKYYYFFFIYFLIINLTVKSQIAGFIIPDTVCVNQNITIQNTTVGGSTYYWNFCSGNLSNVPIGLNMGNIGSLNQPVYSSIAKDGNNYFVFITNILNGTLTRLAFGSSLTNTPVATNLGTLGVMGMYIEGIQIKKDSLSGNWFGFVVGGQINYLVRLSFGNSLNNIPTATNLGNINNLMSYSHTIYTFREGGNWYSLIGNFLTSNLLKLSFGNSLANMPTATNLGNIGGLNGPVGFYPIQENGNMYLFVTNQNNSTLSRLNFGNSLLNIPTGVNLGNINGTMNDPRSITILRDCGHVFGFVVNEITNDIVRLTFPGGLTTMPVGVSLGNIANFSFPHHISELFRVGDSLYAFIMNVNNSTISRLCFTGCNNASVPSSNLQNPPVVSYNSPGTYNVSLVVNEGLPTQSVICKEVVVVVPVNPVITGDTTICAGDTLKLISNAISGCTYQWTGPNGYTSTNPNVIIPNTNAGNSGTYSLIITKNGCTSQPVNKTVSVSISPIVSLGNDTSLCQVSNLILNANNPGCSYLWSTGQTSQTISINSNGTYFVKVTNSNGCTGTDTIHVLINPKPLDLSDTIDASYNGILAHYPFDNNTNDTSGHNYHGILSGPIPTTDRFNNPNKAYLFNGNNQFVTVPYDIWSDELTLSAWTYPTNFGSTNPSLSGKMIIFKAPNTGVNQDYDLAVGYFNNIPKAFFVFGQGTGSYIALISNSSLQTNQWYLITATRKNGIAKLYINGNLDNSIIYSFALYNQHHNLKLGMSHAPIQSFTGKLDDLRIYKRELCSREIKSLYHNQFVINAYMQDTLFCTSNSTFLQLINPEPGISYQLNHYPSGIPIGNPQITYCDSVLSFPTGNIAATSFYTVLATDTATGCSRLLDSIFKVTINPGSLTLFLGNDTSICLGNNIILNANNPGCSYLWSTGQTSQTISINSNGTYFVKVTNSSGCYASDTINVNVVSNLTVNLGNDTTICQGEVLLLNAGNAGSTYLWNTGSNSQTINIQNAGIYWVQVNISNCSGTDTIQLTIIPKPVISLGKDTVMCPGDLIILSPGVGFSQYLWSDGSVLNHLNVNNPGTYTVKVSDGLCSASDVVFIDECGSEIWVPNVFTPNGDGMNEIFLPVYTNIDKITLFIYNRWGNRIFEGSGKSAVWDGKYAGDPCGGGVYYYLIEYEHKGSTKGMRQLHGSVTLLR